MAPPVGQQAFRTIDGLIDRVEGIAGTVTSAFHNKRVGIGVTGLAGAGKTVFITSLIQNLLARQRMPLFRPLTNGQIEDVVLTTQNNTTIPRFALEKHLDALVSDPPSWPESTSQLSQIRLAIQYRPNNFVTRTLSSSRWIYLDIIDYPGEWLMDLPLMSMTYQEWCQQVSELIKEEPRKSYAQEWIKACRGINVAETINERQLLRLSEEFRKFLLLCKESDHKLSNLQPGRFIMPGDMAGSPALTFSPLLNFEMTANEHASSYRQVMQDRFEAYKSQVVRPFFADHFSRIDRQFVLVDLLGAISSGSASVKELEVTLQQVLKAFRPGKVSWISSLLLGRRISHLCFAATKADLLPRNQHQKLQNLLKSFFRSEQDRSRMVGAEVGFSALAALRSTESAAIKQSNQQLEAVVGLVAGKENQTAIFPGDLPDDFRSLKQYEEGDFIIPRLLPPALNEIDHTGLPHIGLDKSIDFLLEGAFQ